MSLVDLRKALKENKLKFGVEQTLKLLKKGEVKEVFVASNCPEEWINRVKRHCEISGCKFVKLEENSNDLGSICKKPFSVNMCSYIK